MSITTKLKLARVSPLRHIYKFLAHVAALGSLAFLAGIVLGVL